MVGVVDMIPPVLGVHQLVIRSHIGPHPLPSLSLRIVILQRSVFLSNPPLNE